MNEVHADKATLDDETAEHIANALWMSAYDPTRIPESITEKIFSKNNSSTASRPPTISQPELQTTL